MKPLVCLLLLSLTLLAGCDQTHKLLELDTGYDQEFKQMPFTGKYVFSITKEQVDKLESDKWFFFVEVEPDQSKEWISTQIDLSVGKKDAEESTSIKKCDALKGGVDSCFLTSKQFDYTAQQVHVKVNCRGPCKFKLSAEVSAPYKLTPGKTIRMDFQNTAYSKIFTLDTTKNDNFDQLRIILRPDGFLSFPAPIRLYINQDATVPTKYSHDLKGMTLWDNGLGVFLDMPQAKGIFTMLVEGPQDNVLLLQTQLISFKQTSQIPEVLPYFDYLGEGSTRKYKAKVNPSKGTCLQLTTFSGAVKLINIFDQDLNEIDGQFPPLYRSYGDLQYQLDPKFFAQNSDEYKIDNYIVFQIEGVKQSTFVVEAYELNTNIAHLLPQRTRYVQIPSKKYHQYYIQIVELASSNFKKSQFQIILTTEQGQSVNPRFFNCKKQHGSQCQLKASQVETKDLSTKDLQQTSNIVAKHLANGVSIYKFSIPSKEFQKPSNQTRKYILVVLLQNKEQVQQLYTIQFINSGKNVYLKQGEVKTDRVSIDQSKYYTFTNHNSDASEIRVHVMEISGRVFVEGYTQDPRKSDQSGKEILEYRNSVRFPVDKKGDQTIYLKVTGKENAFYSVQLQIIKESQRQWWNRTHEKDTKGYNELIIVEGISYQFNIKAKSKEVFQVHSKESKFFLDISSHLPLELCMTEQLKKAPFPPNCEVKELLSKSKIYEITLERGKIGNIGVTNNNDKDVKFNIRITGQDNVKPIEDNINKTASDTTNMKCLPGVLGKINKHNFQKNSSSCYTYDIIVDKYVGDLQVIADIVSDQYDKVDILVEINDLQKVQVIGATHIFQRAQLVKACSGRTTCSLKIFIYSQIDTEIRLTAEYMAGKFFLLDGIAHQFTGSDKPRHFVYELYNKVNTTIVMENKNGFYKFFGKVVDGNKYWTEEPTFPTATDNDIQSTNPFYYLYQISTLTDIQIKSTQCEECLLIITVVRQQGSFDHTKKSKFVIECTQQDRYLKDNRPVFAYLNHRSFAFYQFYNKQNGSILISVNSQNQQCIKVFIKQGNKERASGSAFDKQTQTDKSSLVLQNAVVGQYSITLQATANCYYSIDVTSSANGLSTIEKGHFKDLTLQKHEQTKFIYQNNDKQNIKMLTLHVNGQITIKAKTYVDTKTLMADNLSKVKYDWSGKDFLNIQSTDKKYCTKCVYLIVVEAEKQTKTSLMIPQKDSEFPIIMDSFVKDELKKDQVQTLRIFTHTITQFQVNVQYGQIKIEILTSHNNQVEFTKVFSASQSKQYQNISRDSSSSGTKPVGDYVFMRYNRVKITANKDSGFTFGFISSKDQSKRGNRVKYGVPQYVNLSPKKKECLMGMLDDSDQQFLISITGQKQQYIMNNLEIQCTVNGKILQLSKNIAKNELIVTIDNSPLINNDQYQFCMLSNDSVFLTFIHSSRLNYFPQSQAILVSKSMNLSFYSEGRSLIEINECKSRAIVSISRSFNTLGGMNSEIKQVRKTNNIIEFNQYGPVYVHVQAQTATVSWRKKNQLTKEGYGYDEYSSNKIRIDKSDNVLNVDVFPLRKIVDKPNVVFDIVEYIVYIAEQQLNLYDAINCNHGKFVASSSTYSSRIDDVPLPVKFDIESILTEFQNKKYVLVGVLARGTPQNESSYRFIYPYQQILMSALKSSSNQLKYDDEHEDIAPNPINKDKIVVVKEESAFNTFVLYFTFIVIIAFLAIWVYRKWIKKMLKRRRQQLSEQGTGEVRYQQFTSYT